MGQSIIKVDPKKLWKSLCEADVLNFESEEELRFIVKYYPAEASDGHVASVSLTYPETTDDAIELSEDEIMGCEAEWDRETEEITITKISGSKCYLPPFRLYKEFRPDLSINSECYIPSLRLYHESHPELSSE